MLPDTAASAASSPPLFIGLFLSSASEHDLISPITKPNPPLDFTFLSSYQYTSAHPSRQNFLKRAVISSHCLFNSPQSGSYFYQSTETTTEVINAFHLSVGFRSIRNLTFLGTLFFATLLVFLLLHCTPLPIFSVAPLAKLPNMGVPRFMFIFPSLSPGHLI